MSILSMQTETGMASTDAVPPLKVYKFLTRFGVGGTEMQVLGLAEHFDPSRYHLAFGCMHRHGDAGKEYGNRGWSISEYPISRFASLTAGRQMLRLSRELRVRRPDVLHSYNFYANVFSIPAARLAGVPCIVASIRDMGVYMSPMQKRVQRWVCELADRIVVNADAIRNWLIDEGYPSGKIRVIRNGARLPASVPENMRSKVRAELGIPDTGKVVIMVSRLNPKKGIENLLDAAPEVLSRVPSAWFVIVGDIVLESTGQEASYSKRLAGRARELGIAERVLFTGLRRDVPRLLSAADISVLPSLSEGLPNAVIEAMAAGLPVVATSVGGIPELIQQGRNGMLVPPGDTAALAESLATVLSNPFLSRRLGEAARLRIQAGFSFEKMFRETVALYRATLAEKEQARRRWAEEGKA